MAKVKNAENFKKTWKNFLTIFEYGVKPLGLKYLSMNLNAYTYAKNLAVAA